MEQVGLPPPGVPLEPNHQVVVHPKQWDRGDERTAELQNPAAINQHTLQVGDVLQHAVGENGPVARVTETHFPSVHAVDPIVDSSGAVASQVAFDRSRVHVDGIVDLIEDQRAESAVRTAGRTKSTSRSFLSSQARHSD